MKERLQRLGRWLEEPAISVPRFLVIMIILTLAAQIAMRLSPYGIYFGLLAVLIWLGFVAWRIFGK